jgi:hypothetical protein
MRKPLFLVLIFGSAFFLFGCPGDQAPFPPTFTPTNTFKSTKTLPLTHTPTQTDSLSPALAPSPSETAGSCPATDGVWESRERDLMGPILAFRVSDCGIASIDIRKYVVDGELYMVDSHTRLPIEKGAFEYSERSGAGTLILGGIFDTADTAHGTLKFTKGFDIFGTVLSQDVFFSWKAAPV